MKKADVFTTLCALLFLGNTLSGQTVKLQIRTEKGPPQTTGMIIKYCKHSELQKAKQEKRTVKWDSIGTLQKPIPFTKEYTIKDVEFTPHEVYSFRVRLVTNRKLGEPSDITSCAAPLPDDYISLVITWLELSKNNSKEKTNLYNVK